MTDSSEIIARVKQKRISELLIHGKRIDGRGLTDYREIKIERGIIEKAEGSAHVSIGNTKVMAGIKIEIGEPFSDTPEEGVLTVNVELVPLASPTFEPGPPDENAIELARVVDRGIRESKAMDLKKLCIVPGKTVFVVFVDIYVLDHDGNLFDASSIASLVALMNARMPKYEIKENGEIELKKEYTQLPILNHPITVTMVKMDGKLVVDPSLDEENVTDVRISIAIDKDENICAVQKGGPETFNIEDVFEAVKIAREKMAENMKIIMGG